MTALSLLAASTGCADADRVQKLEDRVTALEQQQKRVQQDVADRQRKLESCVQIDADNAYWDYVRLNGKPVSGQEGVYKGPRYMWDEAAKRKQQKIEECKLLYGR